MTTKKNCMILLGIAVALLNALPANAQEGPQKQYVFKVAIYQIFTNVTGNGLISQTLPGIEGWRQIIHEKLDGVELVMDGDTITWNGKPAPDHPRISLLAAPTCTVTEGQEVTAITESPEPIQYMTRKEGNLFELHTVTEGEDAGGLRLVLSLLPRPSDRPGHVECDLKFSYKWIKDRQKVEDVSLPIGKPIIARRETSGNVMMELGKWSCLAVSTDSQGTLYVFINCTPA